MKTVNDSPSASTQEDQFRKSPEPIQEKPSLKRKASVLEESDMSEGEQNTLIERAAKAKKRLSGLDPQKRSEYQELNRKIQEARQRCEDLGLKYKDE